MPLLQKQARALPRFHALSDFEHSVTAYAHRRGINADELDALAQGVQRLVKYHSTVVTKSVASALQPMADLGYFELTPTTQGTFLLELLVAGSLVTAYFWSVLIPHHFQSCSYQVAVMPNLVPMAEVQHCSVVFQIQGARETTRQFLTDLAHRFSDLRDVEIVHIQAGYVVGMVDQQTADAGEGDQ